jgi:hypothetical protein
VHDGEEILRSPLEFLSNEFLAFSPEGFSGHGIKRVCANTSAVGGNHVAVGNDLANVAILAVSATDLIGRGHDCGPD